MRYILALIIAVPLLAVSLEADAGLVEDLRSGKSNVRAEIELSPWGKEMYRKYMHGLKSNPDYKAFVTYRGGDWIQGWSGSASAEQAIKESLKYCKEKRPTGAQCRVYAVGHTVVAGYSQKKLADAIEAYQLEVSGSKTTTKSTTSSERTFYCINPNGSFYTNRSYDFTGVCGPDKEITKAEYERLKNKKKDTATTEPDTASSGDDPLEAKLGKLKKLLEKGLITEEEAAAKRAKLLEDL